MKNVLLFLGLSLGPALCAQDKGKEDIIRHEYRFSRADADNVVAVENINGSIAVEGYEGDRVVIEVTRTIDGTTESRERGGEEVQVGFIEKDEALLAYLKTPCHVLAPESITSADIRKGFRNDWGKDCKWQPRYDFRLDYRIRVPRNVSLRLTTVNNGNIEVRRVTGSLTLQNVNGGITLEEVAGNAEVNTVNGDLQIRYSRLPSGGSKFYTLNGDINAFFPAGLSAELFFKSFNGEFFTDVDGVEPMAPTLEKTKSGEGDGVEYKVSARQGFRVGKGGPARLEFETFNGDLYLRKQG